MTTTDLKDRVANGGEVATVNDAPPTVKSLIERMRPEIQRALPKHISADRLVRIATTVIKQSPQLAQCTPESFLGALMTSAQLGLEPGPLGEAYFVPFKREVTFIPGYRGLIKLAWQSGRIQSLAAHAVYERDEFDYAYGLSPVLVHKPSLTDRGDFIATYAVAEFKDGGNAFVVMSKEDVDKIRDRSRASGNGPWVTDFAAMACKTAIRQLSKMLPMSVEMAQAISQDEQVRTHIDADALDLAPAEDVVEAEVVEEGAA